LLVSSRRSQIEDVAAVVGHDSITEIQIRVAVSDKIVDATDAYNDRRSTGIDLDEYNTLLTLKRKVPE